MQNIFKKTVWNDSDWKIYLNNLELLLKKYGMKKKEFNRRIGVQNAFRSDVKTLPSRGTVLTICKEFNINEEWLSTPHTHPTTVREPDKMYEDHGGWKPRLLGEDYEYAGKVLKILESKTPYSVALKANIDAFYNAMETSKKYSECMEDIRRLELRIIELEKKLDPEKV